MVLQHGSQKRTLSDKKSKEGVLTIVTTT